MQDVSPRSQDDHVLLIHGLAENSAWMWPLYETLAAQGYCCHLMDYPSTRKSADDLTHHDLRARLLELQDAPRLHLVTHSMGGILVRNYLAHYDIPNLGRIVMIAPAHDGSPTMTAHALNPFFPLLLGPSGLESKHDADCFARTLPGVAGYDVGIIAGCLPLDPIGLLTMPWPHDGKTTVEGTKIDGMKDHTTVPASHDTILGHPATLVQTESFLENGKFIN